jgi:RNA polymerase sigma factor (sigma-70 family)
MRRSRGKGNASCLNEAKSKLASVAPTVVRAVGVSECVAADVAEDAVQSAIRDLLRQWKAGGVPGDIRSFKAYLWRCAVNVIHEWTRKRKDARLLVFRPPVGNPAAACPDPEDSAPGPETAALQADDYALVYACVAALSDKERYATLQWACGHSAAQTASGLGCSETHARILKHGALQKLKKRLNPRDSA